jgi:outer membrane protein
MRPILAGLVLLLLCAAAVDAQERLSLPDAIARARAANPALRAARAVEGESAARHQQAQGAWWPRVDVSEGIQRGDLPVYVFGSLLSQRRFTEANFAIESLNNPDPLTNHRAAVMVQQPLFSHDVLTGVRSARVAKDLATVGRDAVERDLAVDATRAFGQALVAQTAARAAQAATAAAEEDLRRAQNRRATGLVTDADVLLVEVHLAQMRARVVDADAQRLQALASLNRVMGEPLAREYVLDAPVPPGPDLAAVEGLETEALAARPEARQAALREELAHVQRAGAKSALYPQVGWQGGYEWNGGSFSERAGGWMVGAEVRLNLFRGLADRARLAETAQALERARAEREAAESAIRLDVRSAWLRLRAAHARRDVGRAAVAQAREGQRIIRDRYENGLAGVDDVLRAAQALVDAELQQTAADADVVIEAAALERAVGR